MENNNEDNNQGFSEDEVNTGLSETLKKLLTAGVGAAFMTEESIRSYLKTVKLPKDVLNMLLQNANKSKMELMDRVTDEVVKVIKKIDFVQEASRFVEEHTFKINAEITVNKRTKAKD